MQYSSYTVKILIEIYIILFIYIVFLCDTGQTLTVDFKRNYSNACRIRQIIKLAKSLPQEIPV